MNHYPPEFNPQKPRSVAWLDNLCDAYRRTRVELRAEAFARYMKRFGAEVPPGNPWLAFCANYDEETESVLRWPE